MYVNVFMLLTDYCVSFISKKRNVLLLQIHFSFFFQVRRSSSNREKNHRYL
ncbi:hypothetical protein N665_0185s0060 [Sinapis alba]|nr:hypothetical protein N665_0185s0060 [Sinapis alba]KAF8103789.1 hypothetical protein N665_0185s0060 [Sinapis alba]